MYDWDEDKRETNLAKHGVDFSQMEAFDWETAVVDLDEGHDEPRYIAMGCIGATVHFVVWTEREHRIRIISMRQATRREVREYVKESR